MYLVHNTELESILDILKDNELRSLSLIKKYNKCKSPNEGDGIYDTNNFVYFTCTDKINNKDILIAPVLLFFDTKLLYNRAFYINNGHTSHPSTDGKKYNRYYNNYNLVIKNLYEGTNSKYFQVMMQITVKNKVNLKYLVAIQFMREPSQKLLNYIKKNYPNVTIINA